MRPIRFYAIAIDGGKTYSARNNPAALQVEFDITVIDAENSSAASGKAVLARAGVKWVVSLFGSTGVI